MGENRKCVLLPGCLSGVCSTLPHYRRWTELTGMTTPTGPLTRLRARGGKSLPISNQPPMPVEFRATADLPTPKYALFKPKCWL